MRLNRPLIVLGIGFAAILLAKLVFKVKVGFAFSKYMLVVVVIVVVVLLLIDRRNQGGKG